MEHTRECSCARQIAWAYPDLLRVAEEMLLTATVNVAADWSRRRGGGQYFAVSL